MSPTRNLTLSDAHSENHPTAQVNITLEGGSPSFGYLWINDVCYTITEGRTVKIRQTYPHGIP